MHEVLLILLGAAHHVGKAGLIVEAVQRECLRGVRVVAFGEAVFVSRSCSLANPRGVCGGVPATSGVVAEAAIYAVLAIVCRVVDLDYGRSDHDRSGCRVIYRSGIYRGRSGVCLEEAGI